MKKMLYSMVVFSLVFFVMSCGKEVKTEKAVVKIPTSICGQCANTIKTAVMKLDGIKSVDVNTETKLAMIEFIPASVKVTEIEDAIVMSGYGANEKAANKEAFDKLPDCCRKEEL
ncbi:cation transporter [bacterium]|nr:cation transporter [bacterium]